MRITATEYAASHSNLNLLMRHQMLITATEYAASHFNLNLLMQVITEC